MKIIVFVKAGPGHGRRPSSIPKTGNLMREGVQSIMNPLSTPTPLRTALRLKEKYGGHGSSPSAWAPPQADDVLKKALAMGCDESALLSDRALGGADTLATGYPLAKAAEKIGRLRTCLSAAATPPRQRSTVCGEVEIEDGWAVCERLLPDRTEKVKVKLPALITVCAEANEPRYATPIGIMKALKKPRYTWNAADLGCEPDMIGIPGSPSSNKRIFEPPKRNTDTTYFTGEPEAVAKAIADVLEAEHII